MRINKWNNEILYHKDLMIRELGDILVDVTGNFKPSDIIINSDESNEVQTFIAFGFLELIVNDDWQLDTFCNITIELEEPVAYDEEQTIDRYVNRTWTEYIISKIMFNKDTEIFVEDLIKIKNEQILKKIEYEWFGRKFNAEDIEYDDNIRNYIDGYHIASEYYWIVNDEKKKVLTSTCPFGVSLQFVVNQHDIILDVYNE